MEVDEPVELQLSIWTNDQFLKRGLVVPRLEEGREFKEEVSLLLEVDPAVRFTVDMSVKAQTIESSGLGLQDGGFTRRNRSQNTTGKPHPCKLGTYLP